MRLALNLRKLNLVNSLARTLGGRKMSEKFFERLRERAWLKLRKGKDLGEYNEVVEKLAIGPANGVNATIEALKEMVVIPLNKMRHLELGYDWEEDPVTALRTKGGSDITIADGHHGTDGEEVTVMVFRDAS